MSIGQQKATDALDTAKAYWPMGEDETHIPNDFIQLRELCHALELLLGNLPQEEGNWVDTDAYMFVLEALNRILTRSFAGAARKMGCRSCETQRYASEVLQVCRILKIIDRKLLDQIFKSRRPGPPAQVTGKDQFAAETGYLKDLVG